MLVDFIVISLIIVYLHNRYKNMSIRKAYKIWEEKQGDSAFKKIRYSSSGSFYIPISELFSNKGEARKYAETLREALKNREESIAKK